MSGQQFWWSHKFREWKSTAYGLIFPRKPSNVFICMLPLWVYQIPSVYRRVQQTFILLKGRVMLFMLFVFQGIRTCKDQAITGMTISTLKSFCTASDSQILRIYFNSSVLCIPTEIFIFWKFDYMMTSGKEERSELCIHQQMMWLEWTGMFGTENHMSMSFLRVHFSLASVQTHGLTDL